MALENGKRITTYNKKKEKKFFTIFGDLYILG